MKTGTPQLKALYSMEIVDYDRNNTEPLISNIENRITDTCYCRFTPLELYGYYKSGRILMFNSNILDVDANGFTESKFVARYFDKKSCNICVVEVNSSKVINKSIDYQLFNIIEISDNLLNKSLYSPSEILEFIRNGNIIKYNNSILNTDFELTNGELYCGYFFNSKNTPYSITVNSDKSLEFNDVGSPNNSASDSNVLLEIVDSTNLGKSLYTPLEMLDLSGNKIFTYNGNIINTDLTLSNKNLYVGFYMDGFTMSVFRIKVDANKNLEYSTYKKIIRQIEIFNDDGKYDNFTINGAIDNLDYYIRDVKNLTFVWDTARHFETWITIDARNYNCNLIFPRNTEFIRDEVLTDIEQGRKRELSVKDGIIVSAPVGEEWIDFD